jgi:hypothetical protein
LLFAFVTANVNIQHVIRQTIMADPFFELDWWTCPKGFRLANRRLLNSGEYVDDVDVLVPNSEERIPYRPLDKYPDLSNVFANVRTSDGLLNFYNSYGPLLEHDSNWGDPVPGALQTTQLFRELLHRKKQGPKKLASFFKSRSRVTVVDKAAWEEATGEPWPGFEPGTVPTPFPVAAVDLAADPETGVRLKIRLENLEAALWCQLGQKLSGSTNFRECRQCRRWFEAGPGTRRRADAEFCSDKHRVNFNSLKRTNYI